MGTPSRSKKKKSADKKKLPVTRKFFEDAGRKGGLKATQSLSAAERKALGKKLAEAKKAKKESTS